MHDPFKVKKTIKRPVKKERYIIRRVYHRWEMSSGGHVILGYDLNEMAQIMDELEGNTEVVHPSPVSVPKAGLQKVRKQNGKAQKKVSKSGKKSAKKLPKKTK